MSKHTPEPWAVDEYMAVGGLTGMLIDNAGNHIGTAFNVTMSAEAVTNARRIVTCVNACAGMADPAAEIAELKRQRDELMSLAERLVQWDLDYPVNCYNGYAGLQALNAIIRDNKVAITKGSAS